MQSVDLTMLLRVAERWGSIIKFSGMYQETSIASHQQIPYQRQKGCQQRFKSQEPNIVKQIGWKERNGLTLVLFIVLILNEHSISYYIQFSFYIKGQVFYYMFSVDCSILLCTHSPLHSYDRSWLKVKKNDLDEGWSYLVLGYPKSPEVPVHNRFNVFLLK